MFLSWYQNLPLNLNPVAFAIDSFSVRWYGLSYLIGFTVVYFILIWRIKHDKNCKFADHLLALKKREPKSNIKHQISKIILDLLLVSFFSALIGGRLGFAIFYNREFFFANPWAIVSPLSAEGNMIIGIYGMSYHGALAGVLLGNWLFLRIKKMDFLLWADFASPAVAFGYFFGRIGNFLNGELYGRVTNSYTGMHFLTDPNHLRHPSQLYEAILEGLVLFVLLSKLRKFNLSKGLLFSFYIIGYGILRIIAEFFREPDPKLGYLMGVITMGQLLSMIMIVVGLILIMKLQSTLKYDL